MQNAAGAGASAESEGRRDIYDRIVGDLGVLMEQVEATKCLIEAAIARESAAGQEELAPNVIVLDDVTPRYAKANATLNACKAGLSVALHILEDTPSPQRHSGDNIHRRA